MSDDDDIPLSIPEVRWRREWSRTGKPLVVLPPITVQVEEPVVPPRPAETAEVLESDELVDEHEQKGERQDRWLRRVLLVGAGMTWGFASGAFVVRFYELRDYDVQTFARHALVVVSTTAFLAGLAWWVAVSTPSTTPPPPTPLGRD